MTEIEKMLHSVLHCHNWQFLQIAAPLSAHSYFYSVNISILSIYAVVFLQLL